MALGIIVVVENLIIVLLTIQTVRMTKIRTTITLQTIIILLAIRIMQPLADHHLAETQVAPLTDRLVETLVVLPINHLTIVEVRVVPLPNRLVEIRVALLEDLLIIVEGVQAVLPLVDHLVEVLQVAVLEDPLVAQVVLGAVVVVVVTDRQ